MAASVAVAGLPGPGDTNEQPSSIPVAAPVDLLDISNGSDAALAAKFEQDGYCVAPGVADESQLEACRAAALEALNECKARDPGMGVGQKAGYKEIVQRMPGRYEMRYGLDREPLLNLRRRVEKSSAFETARRILRDELRILGCSVVIAERDCAAQAWHVDGAHLSLGTQACACAEHLRSAVDVTRGGGTEIKPGSFLTRNLAKQMLLARIKKPAAARRALVARATRC